MIYVCLLSIVNMCNFQRVETWFDEWFLLEINFLHIAERLSIYNK